MNEKVFALVLGLFAVFVPIKASNSGPRLEDIHAGAVFTNNGVSVILVETWNDRFFLGNSWGIKYRLFSNFTPSGATAEECCAYLRGEGYKYAGKAE